MQKAVVILPTFNERDNIAQLIDKIQEQFKRIKNYSMHILVVDDNSPDGTQTLVRRQIKKYSNVSLLTGEKQGLGKAYIRGMDYAINKLKATVVFEMDADFSHDPKKIPQLLRKLDEGYDIVVGARYIKGGSIPKNWGIHRKILSRVGNTLVRSILLRFDIHDWTSGFRAVRSQAYLKVRRQLLDFTSYTFQVAFLHKALLSGKKIGEVPIHFTDRFLGKSKIPFIQYITSLIFYLIKQTIISPPRILRFAVVGALGALVQLSSLQAYRAALFFQLAFFLSIETAIVSNFIFSNLWTFADRKLKTSQIPAKFIQFNLASAGSIIIQQAVALIGENTIGLKPLFTTPIISINVDTGMMYAILGILLGMFWNFFAYSKIIWKKK